MKNIDRRKFIKTVGAGTAIMTAPGMLRASNPTSEKSPNIVLIMADDMGFSDIGCYGSEIDTPNIDGLAAGGVKFSQFYNCARCCPTRASLMTGLYPHQTGIGHMTGREFDYGNPGNTGRFSNQCVTIAEALGQAGYHSLMGGKWHLGTDEGTLPVDRGFDQYYGILEGAANYFDPDWLYRNRKKIEAGENYYTTDAFTDNAIKMIKNCRRRDENPYFLYLAYNAPHWPLHAKPEDIAKYEDKYVTGWDTLREERYERQVAMGLINKKWPLSPREEGIPAWNEVDPKLRKKMARKMAVYAAMVDSMDQNIGKLVGSIKSMGELDNTLIMFLSDNGACAEIGTYGVDSNFAYTGFKRTANKPIGSAESFASYGRSWSNACNTPFRLHKKYAHEGGIATPLVVHWPEAIKQTDKISNQQGHIIDIMATCLDVANAPYPASYKNNEIIPLEGKSLLPIFKGKVRKGHEILGWEHIGNRGLRRGKWKIASDHPGNWELFDMEADRTELNNLAETYPKKLDELVGLYDDWAGRCGVQPWKPINQYWPWIKKTIRENIPG